MYSKTTQYVDENGAPVSVEIVKTGQALVRIDPRYFRPTEVETLLGDASKARAKLGWSPEISFEKLVKEMMAADLRWAERDDLARRHGHKAFQYHE